MNTRWVINAESCWNCLTITSHQWKMSSERVKSDASRSIILFKWKNSRSCQTTPFMSALLLYLGLGSLWIAPEPLRSCTTIPLAWYLRNFFLKRYRVSIITSIFIYIYLYMWIRIENIKFSKTSGSEWCSVDDLDSLIILRISIAKYYFSFSACLTEVFCSVHPCLYDWCTDIYKFFFFNILTIKMRDLINILRFFNLYL